MTVTWEVWQAERKALTPEAERQQRSTDRLKMTGYWRIEAAKTKPDYPVMIWTEAGKEHLGTIFQIGRKVMNTEDNAKEWTDFTDGSWHWCVPVSREDYAAALQTGFWPGDRKPARQMTPEEKLGVDLPRGDNAPPTDESLAEQIAALVGKIEAHKVTDQASANKASEYLDQMRALLNLAKAAFEVEKAPWLDGGRKIDAKWNGIRDPGINAGALLKMERDRWLKNEQDRLDAITAAENKKRRDEAEAENRRRQAEAEALAAAETERLRKEAEQHGQMVDEAEIAERVAETVVLPAEVKPVEVAAPVAKASSAFGRGTTAKKTKVAKITDLPKLASHFCFISGTIDDPVPDADFLEYMQKRADKARRGGVTLPGVEIVEE